VADGEDAVTVDDKADVVLVASDNVTLEAVDAGWVVDGLGRLLELKFEDGADNAFRDCSARGR